MAYIYREIFIKTSHVIAGGASTSFIRYLPPQSSDTRNARNTAVQNARKSTYYGLLAPLRTVAEAFAAIIIQNARNRRNGLAVIAVHDPLRLL